MFHLITGGSGSGKSEYAEQKLMEYASHSKRNKKRYYIATMIPFGKETEEKIARHRKLRAGKGFETIECYTDLLGKLNLRMGERADLVTEVVYGIPVERKDIKK